MKKYKFVATTIIEANSEDVAKEIFANESYNFASMAEVEELEIIK